MSSKKEPWDCVPDKVWKTEAAFWSWVRGALRKEWSRHPVKLEFIKRNRILVPNPNPGGRKEKVYGMECTECKEHFPMPLSRAVKNRIKNKYGIDVVCIEIDHINPASSLRSKDDVGPFATRLLYVTLDELRAVCKPCHDIITYMEGHSCSKEEAILKKKVIRYGKMGVVEQKGLLEGVGYAADQTSNSEKRQACFAEAIMIGVLV